MQMDLSFFINSALLGVGLAMDAFTVSVANGLAAPDMSRRRRAAIPLTFALFQFMMPVIGWFCVRAIADAFAAFSRAIPWIALALLAGIGLKMVIEGVRDRDEVCPKPRDAAESDQTGSGGPGAGTLLAQGIATSIDALSVGFTLARYGAAAALVSALIIAAVTWVICAFGVRVGRKFGEKLAGRASIVGGVILIAIGLEILLRGL